jgi:hypothetical protein
MDESEVPLRLARMTQPGILELGRAPSVRSASALFERSSMITLPNASTDRASPPGMPWRQNGSCSLRSSSCADGGTRCSDEAKADELYPATTQMFLSRRGRLIRMIERIPPSRSRGPEPFSSLAITDEQRQGSFGVTPRQRVELVLSHVIRYPGIEEEGS